MPAPPVRCGPDEPGRKVHPMRAPWIAACCIVRELPLATSGIKDYTDFAEHEGLELVL